MNTPDINRFLNVDSVDRYPRLREIILEHTHVDLIVYPSKIKTSDTGEVEFDIDIDKVFLIKYAELAMTSFYELIKCHLNISITARSSIFALLSETEPQFPKREEVWRINL